MTARDFFDFWEIRTENRLLESLNFEDEKVKIIEKEKVGISLRVFKNGKQAFLSSSSEEDLNKLFKKAKTFIKFGKSYKYDLTNTKSIKEIHKPLINPFNIDLSEKKELGLTITKNVLNSGKIKSVSGRIKSTKRTLNIETSDGVNSKKIDFNAFYFFQAIAKKGNNLQRFFERDYAHKGYEHFKKLPIQEVSQNLINYSNKLLEAKRSKGGNRRVLLDNEMTGLFFHEAVGHGLEADFMLNNSSVFNKKLGQKVGSEVINFSDGVRVKESLGYYGFDDEGTKKIEVPLIEKGILKGYLQNQRTSGELNMKKTGNARSQTVQNIAIPRMSVLHVKKGDMNEEELIKELKNGLLVKGFTGGEVSPLDGKFIFGSSLAYEVRKGEVCELVRDVNLIGRVQETLFNVENFGNKEKINHGGICGKNGQHAPVNELTPYMLVSEVSVGGV